MSPELSPTQLKTVKVLTARAADECSRMFTKWLRSPVELLMEETEVVSFGDVMARAGDSAEASVVMYMPIERGLTASMILALDEASALEVAGLLVGKKSDSVGDNERSALAETINIIGCAYLNSLASGTGAALTPGPPAVIVDLLHSVLDSLLTEQAMAQDSCLQTKVQFKLNGKSADWKFFFLPTFASLREVLK